MKNGDIARYTVNRKIGTVIWHDEDEMEIVTENLEQYIDEQSKFEIVDVATLISLNERYKEALEYIADRENCYEDLPAKAAKALEE